MKSISKHIIIICVIFIAFCKNARTTNNTKIVGGNQALINEFPYQVSLQWNFCKFVWFKPTKHFCGGSVLTEKWILTAAHCNENFSFFGRMEAMVGETNFDNLNNFGSNKQIRIITKFLVHEKYLKTVKTGPFDIGMAKVDNSFSFNEFVQPVFLPTIKSVPTGKAILSGWGSTSSTSLPKHPQILQKATLPIVDIDKCKSIYQKIVAIYDSNICAGNLIGNIAACSGDSGGPLIQKVSNVKFVQIGIVSYGPNPCGQPNRPGVYTRVSYFIDWIQDKIRNE